MVRQLDENRLATVCGQKRQRDHATLNLSAKHCPYRANDEFDMSVQVRTGTREIRADAAVNRCTTARLNANFVHHALAAWQSESQQHLFNAV